MYSGMSEQMMGSCMSYSKAISVIEAKWGVMGPGAFSSGRRIDQLVALIEVVVREQCRQAVEEARFRLLRLAARHLPDRPEVGLYIPRTEIYINTGNVGTMKLLPFCGHRDDPTP